MTVTEEERDGHVIRRGEGLGEFEPADVPLEKTRCPSCGTAPTDESVVMHRLASSGYVHDDVWLDCAADDCDRTWTLGIPLGECEPEFYEWRTCGCGEVALIHRMKPLSSSAVKVHLKCPRCFAFWQERREVDGHGLVLGGHPAITGDTAHESVKPYGYERDER